MSSLPLQCPEDSDILLLGLDVDDVVFGLTAIAMMEKITAIAE